jgi:hypothetical protein
MAPHLKAVAVGVVALLIAAACGQQPDGPSTPATTSTADLPGCQAAIANVDYGNILVIPDETRAVIESYRSLWRDFCSAATPKPTMAELVAKAKLVEERFDEVFVAYLQKRTPGERDANADAISDLVSKTYPGFVPAFEGSFYEQEFFRPSLEEFKKHAQLGTAQDIVFFGAGIPFHSEFPAWMERTWDYGGCLRFGEFNWTDALEKIVQLKRVIESDIYRNLIGEYEAAVIESLVAEGNVCTCKRKEAVKEDLESALSYLEKEPEFASYIPLVRSKLNAIQTKAITVNSQAEKHCSGG